MLERDVTVIRGAMPKNLFMTTKNLTHETLKTLLIKHLTHKEKHINLGAMKESQVLYWS